MTRLLHAAARGARIIAMDRNLGWIASSHAPLELSNDKRPYRIHPNDKHLAYGPISTALRIRAATGVEVEAKLPYLHGYFAFTRDEDDEFTHGDAFTRSLFLLILAEALADEGM